MNEHKQAKTIQEGAWLAAEAWRQKIELLQDPTVDTYNEFVRRCSQVAGDLCGLCYAAAHILKVDPPGNRKRCKVCPLQPKWHKVCSLWLQRHYCHPAVEKFVGICQGIHKANQGDDQVRWALGRQELLRHAMQAKAAIEAILQ